MATCDRETQRLMLSDKVSSMGEAPPETYEARAVIVRGKPHRSNLVPGCFVTWWRCRSHISGHAALGIRWHAPASSRISASSVFPDYLAPVIRNAGDEHETVLMRWDVPPLRVELPS
jgi:hypothetical protein